MRAAIFLYALFLAIEGGLAWAITGNPFLATAITCGLLFYGAVWKAGGPWGELVRALAAGLIAIAGPLYYKASPVPTMLCFITLPHLLAATQCFWEIALGNDPAQQNVRMRTVVFTVAFYAAMGLVFLLLRGAEDAIPRWITNVLAIVVLLAALPAWDLARVTRLKPGRVKRAAPFGLVVRRLALIAAVLGMIAAVFAGILPAAADKLCAISPRFRAKIDTPEKPAPRPPQQHEESSAGEATRPGMDSSAMTGRHELPQKANLKSLGTPQVHIRPVDRAMAERMAAGMVYVRSHTLDAWKDGAWQAAITGGQWLDDNTDGTADGLITLKQPPLPVVEHTVFLDHADGYSLPALQGVCAWRLPAVYAHPGDLFQMRAAGNIRYDAVSAPVNWDELPARGLLRAGRSAVPAQSRPANSVVLRDLCSRDPLLRPDTKDNLAAQIAGIREWLKQNVSYSTVVKGGGSTTALDNFLVGERKGFCDHYATAASLMLRHSEVPTRIAYGYAGNDYDPATGIFTFTDDSAHAWTEIFLEKYGWTACDFTPQERVGNLGAGPQPEREPFKEHAYDPVEQKKPEVPEKKKPDAFSLAAWWDEAVAKILAMQPLELTKAALKWLALAAIVAFLLRQFRETRKKSRAGEDPFAADERQPAYFAEFLRVFREAGCPRAGGSTPREYFHVLTTRGLAGPEFAPMISYHYGSRYADAGRDAGQEAAWLALAREAERRLKESRGPS
jgi:Transglutaminase-like superfamily